MGRRQALVDAYLLDETAHGGYEYVENHKKKAKAGFASQMILREVNSFDKQHHLLVTVNLNIVSVANRIVFHYWAPNLPPVVIPTALSMNHLQLLHGLESLGSVWVPTPEVASPVTLSDHVRGLANEREVTEVVQSAVDYEDKLLREIAAVSNTTSLDPHISVPFSLYRLPVLGRNEGCLLRSTSTLQLWNWLKLESPEREGSWTDDLLSLLTDSKRPPGGDLKLVLRGVNLPTVAE